MIRRDAGDAFLLITQHDHALLAGRLARHIGGPAFAAPDPLEPVVAGIANHDAGWPLHDDAPTLNKDGHPLHVFEASVPLATKVWSASVTLATELSDYAGLLVSLHVFHLSALNVMAHAAHPSRTDLFEINKFQHRQIEVQEELRRRVGVRADVPLQLGLAAPGTSTADDQLLFNFRLLTAMDRFSLALCCGKPLFPKLDDVRPRPGAAPLPVTTSMPDPRTMLLRPWPFTAPEIVLPINARRVAKTPFASAEAFQDAYRAAPVETLMLTYRRASAN